MSKHPNDATRLAIIQDYLTSDLSKYAIAKKYQISRASILHWIRKFGLEDKPNTEFMSRMKENTPDDFTYRGSTYERERIWTNQIVDGNRESGLMLESYNTDGNMTYKNLTPWIDAAFEELGTARFEGEASNSRIEEYLTHTQLTGAAINDKTSWCAGFANFALESREIEGTGSAMALSFRHFGESLDNPAYGSIATISYGGGKGHVGFVVGKNSNGQILILGGNQGAAKKGGQNEVNISPNSASKFKYNYPAGHKPYYNLPVLNIKGKAVSYETTR